MIKVILVRVNELAIQAPQSEENCKIYLVQVDLHLKDLILIMNDIV